LHSLAVDVRLVEVALAGMRCKQIGGDLLGGIERRFERLACMGRIARSLRQRFDLEPFIQQERQVAAVDRRTLRELRVRFGRGFASLAPHTMAVRPNSVVWKLDAKLAEYCVLGEAFRERLL